MLRHIVFDLDNTLYPAQAGLMAELDRRIARYFTRELKLRPDQAERLQAEYCWQYGTCANGVFHHATLDLNRFLFDIHDIDIRRYLSPDPVLAAMLERLRVRKWVFTNAPIEHARRVLEGLGVADHFPVVFDIRFLEFVGKPDPRAYNRVLAALGARGDECVMVEDSVRNLRPAKPLGMKTVLISQNGAPPVPWVDAVIFHIYELRSALAGRRDGSHRLETGVLHTRTWKALG